MEKGFNDDELADIMNEIESLEKEFAQDIAEDKVESKTEKVETHSVDESEPVMEAADTEHREQAPVAEVEEHGHEEVAHHAENHHVEEVEEEMNEVLGELSKMPVEDIVPEKKHSKVSSHEDHHEDIHHENIHHLQAQDHNKHWHGGGSHTAMSFHVEGEMKFELSFHIAGKYVGLTVTEEGLEIGLDGGAKFTVPVQDAHSHKKAS